MKKINRTLLHSCLLIVLLGVVAHGASAPENCEYIGNNLLTNPSFEVLNNGIPVGPWNAYGQGEGAGRGWDFGAISIGSPGRTGERALQIDASRGNNFYVVQRIPVEAGKTYELSAWAKADESAAGRLELKVEYLPRGETRAQWNVDIHGEWQRLTMRTTAPDDAKNTGVMLRYHGPGTIYFDDASFYLLDCTGETMALADPRAVSSVLSGETSDANVAWWGFDAEDSTDYLQAAIDSGASRVIIPNVGQDWIVRPLTLRSDLELVFEEGVVVSAKKGEYHGLRDAVFNLVDVENVVMRGYGATIRMHKDDYAVHPYEKAEWRHGINIRGGKNVQILGLTIRDTGGDGIYLGRGGIRATNEDIVIRDIVADNNYRQGISVISAKNLLIEDSVVKNTSGTPPMAGIDFEPNNKDELLQDIVVRNSVFEGNEGPGIVFWFSNMASTVSFLFEDVLVRGNREGIRVRGGNEYDEPNGHIVFRNCLVEWTNRSGIQVLNKEGDALHVTFEDCILNNVAASTHQVSLAQSIPIHLSAIDRLGGITFKDVVVADDLDRPLIIGTVSETDEESDATDEANFFNLNGNIEVVNSNGVMLRWEGEIDDVDLDVTQRESVLIDYSRFTSLPEYQDEPVEMRLRPTIRFENLDAVGPASVVHGQLLPGVQLLFVDEKEVTQFEVFLNNDLIYSSDKAPGPEELVIDTTRFDDDRHRLVAVAHWGTDGYLEKETHFISRNFNLVVDHLEGPREIAWFGTVYNPKTIDESDGWYYISDQSDQLFGDPTRKLRKGNTTEYLVWETPRLRRVEVTLYTKESVPDNVLVLRGSANGKDWQDLSYTVEHVDTDANGWRKVVVRGEADLADQVDFMELRFLQSDSDAQIQVGQVVFRLLRYVDSEQ